MGLQKKELNKIIRCCQASINTYEGEHGKVKKVFDKVRHIAIEHIEFDFGIKGDTLYIVWRGSDGKQDWKDNFKFLKTGIASKNKKITPYRGVNPDIQVHEGFIGQYKHVRQDIHGYLKKDFKKFKKIICTGHSLGGALATLCAVDIQYCFGYDVSCYTFGSPRVGNDAFTKSFARRIKKTLRVVYGFDTVTTVPPVIWPFSYSHVGKLLRLKRWGWRFLAIPVFAILGNPFDHYPQKYLLGLQELSGK